MSFRDRKPADWTMEDVKSWLGEEGFDSLGSVFQGKTQFSLDELNMSCEYFLFIINYLPLINIIKLPCIVCFRMEIVICYF